jgi:fatty acid amide hydrolase
MAERTAEGAPPASVQLTSLTAIELAERIRTGATSAAEAVEAYIARIEAVNPRLNSVVWKLYDQARAEAKAADEKRARGEPLGPLHGVPITIKDQFLLKGTPTTWGLLNRQGHRAEADGPLVTRLRAAGAIVLGKTNIPQLLFYNESDNPVYGRCNNPWDAERTPGGSSGGEAATVAAGGSALGLGGDIGGSLRVPAAFCGICTLKPTSGRLTNLDNPQDVGAQGQEAILSQQGILARSVADVALGMRILAAPGQELLDSTIAFYTDNGYLPASPAVRRTVREAADALRSQGIAVEEWTPPDTHEAMRLFMGLLGADGGAWAMRDLGKDQPTKQIGGLLQMAKIPLRLRPAAVAAVSRLYGPRMAASARTIRPLSAEQLWKLQEDRAIYRARFLAAMDAGRYDAILCPPYATPAVRHGATYYLLTPAGSYNMVYNLLGMPAGVVPVSRVQPGEESDRPKTRDAVDKAARETERGSAGLPVAVQVVTRHWREDVALALMASLEASLRGRADYPLTPAI